jgi:hypothetical protein
MNNNGYHGLYGGQVAIGWIINHINEITNIKVDILFMIFNYVVLLCAGLSVGYMVYRLTGNKYGGVLSVPITIFGIKATLALFYCGIIFNIIAMLIILPLIICLYHYILGKKKYKLAIIISIPIGLCCWYFHPSFGSGIFQSGDIQEVVLNPYKVLMALVGIYNVVLLILCVYQIVNKKVKVGIYSIVVISALLLGILLLGIITYGGYTLFTMRVLSNVSLLLGMIICLTVGFALNTKKPLVLFGVSSISLLCFLPGMISWIINCIVRGLPANVILA